SRENMKILMLAQFLSPTRGGGEVMFYQLAHGLMYRGHEIYVIKHKILNSDEDNIGRFGKITIYDIYPPIEHKGGLPASIIQNLLYVINAIRYGIKIIRKESINLIHANNYSPILAGWLLSKITRRPLLVTIHDTTLTYKGEFWKKWMKQFGRLSMVKALIGHIFELLTIKISENIHTVSETSKNDILQLKYGNKKIYVIPNALNLKFYAGNDNVEYRNEVVFIGRLVFYKNLEVVLEALSCIFNHNFKFIVIGDGPMREYWQKLANNLSILDKVEFRGYVSHEEKREILRKASVLVLPSLFEGFGMVILEAWAYKKPIIVANVPPLNQIVTHYKNGFVADPFNPKEWAKYILLTINNTKLAEKLGMDGYKKLIKEYNIDSWIDEFEKLYKQLLIE
ncbi:MAG: glycosyltransferase family 4 protein, partial [Candidatus Methanomethylicia archaeon]